MGTDIKARQLRDDPVQIQISIEGEPFHELARFDGDWSATGFPILERVPLRQNIPFIGIIGRVQAKQLLDAIRLRTFRQCMKKLIKKRLKKAGVAGQ